MQRAYFKAFVAIFVCLTLFGPVTLGSALAGLVAPQHNSGTTQIGPYVVSSGAVYVRSGPGTGFWILGTLTVNESVPVLGISPDGAWWYVNARFGEGWVAGISVTPFNTQAVAVRDPGPIGTITAGTLNVRYGAGVNAATIGHVGLGDQVFVLAQTTEGNWYQIRWAYGTGWVSSRYVMVTAVPMAVDMEGQGGLADGEGVNIPLATDLPYAVVTATYLNVRAGPGINYKTLGSVYASDTLPILGRSADSSWYQVETVFGAGWVSARYVVTRNEYGASPVTTNTVSDTSTIRPIGIINTGALHIRSGPGAQYTSLGSLPGGTETTIIGRNANWSWYLLDTAIGTGWASAGHIIARGDTRSIPYVAPGAAVQKDDGVAPEPELTGPIAFVATGALHIRTGPNSAFSSLGTVYAGTRMPIVGQSPDRGWWLVESPFGEGYVSKRYVIAEGNTSNVPVR